MSVWTPISQQSRSCLIEMWEDGGFSATTDVPAPSEEEAGGDPGTAGLACQFPEPPPEEAGSDPATAGLACQFRGFAVPFCVPVLF